MSDEILTVRGLQLAAGEDPERVVVDGIDLSVREADRIGIVGASGSGKSLTLLAAVGLLPGSVRQTGGDIAIDGRPLAERTPDEVRRVRARRVALLVQGASSSLSPTWTVGFQLEEVVRLHRGVGRRQARIDAIELLRSVSVDEPEHLVHAWPHQISGGQAQRVALALALAGDPGVLLADEPTTGLDGPTASRLLAVLEGACDVRRTALVIVSHDLSVVARCARQLVVMLDGRVVEDGPTDQLLAAPRHPYTRRLIAASSESACAPAGGPAGDAS